MGQIIWTEKAASHLKFIHDYIAEDSPIYAKNFIKALIAATRKLETFPEIGRSVPEFNTTLINLREVIFKGYRIIYYTSPESTIYIITVASGRENITSKLNEDFIL